MFLKNFIYKIIKDEYHEKYPNATKPGKILL